MARLKQIQAFMDKFGGKLDLSNISSPQTRKFKVKANTTNTRDHIILTSSSPADFMISPMPQTDKIIRTIEHSLTGPNSEKRSAETTVWKLYMEAMISNLPLSPPNVESEVIDLLESSDNTLNKDSLVLHPEPTAQSTTQPDISIVPPSTDFGQSSFGLSSDSRDSNASFHTATLSIARHSGELSAQPDQQPEQAMETELEQDHYSPK